MELLADDPTILALRRALDSHVGSVGDAAKHSPNLLVDLIFSCLPRDIVHPVFLPAEGTGAPCVAVSSNPDFNRYGAFAAAY